MESQKVERQKSSPLSDRPPPFPISIDPLGWVNVGFRHVSWNPTLVIRNALSGLVGENHDRFLMGDIFDSFALKERK